MAKTIVFSEVFAGGSIAETKTAKPTFLQRLHAAMVKSRERAAEREIERFINACGGKLTDDLEREIGRRFGQKPHGY